MSGGKAGFFQHSIEICESGLDQAPGLVQVDQPGDPGDLLQSEALLIPEAKQHLLLRRELVHGGIQSAETGFGTVAQGTMRSVWSVGVSAPTWSLIRVEADRADC